MKNDDLNLSPLPEGISLAPATTEFIRFDNQMEGAIQFATHHLQVYPKINVALGSKSVTFEQLNYHVQVIRLLVPKIVSGFEDFLERLCRIVLKEKPHLLEQFNSSLSWRELYPHVFEDGSVDNIKEALVDKALSTLESGKLNTYKRLVSKLDITIPSEHSLDEVFARRNVLIHNGGVPDVPYLKLVPEPEVYSSGGLKHDLPYLKQACEALRDAARTLIEQLVDKGIMPRSELPSTS